MRRRRDRKRESERKREKKRERQRVSRTERDREREILFDLHGRFLLLVLRKSLPLFLLHMNRDIFSLTCCCHHTFAPHTNISSHVRILFFRPLQCGSSSNNTR